MPGVAAVKPEPVPLIIPPSEVVTVNVPVVVTGEPETVKPEGIDNPTDVTPLLLIVMMPLPLVIPIAVPAVSVFLDKPPAELPISNCPAV